ncbi:hypothetical protein PQX77_018153 [Marasmius sp. AFHP31]|nr:hypothetical protein PQX77_018153 [Marasmius sp. AFHP31]
MPTKTVAAALIEAYFDLQHAPWTFSTWKQLTGVPHGLFPSDDGQLPHQWTRQTATDVWSFFQQYNQLPTEKERDKFIKKGEHPGRMLWVNWVQKHWESWGIHDLFITHLKEASAHPFQIMLNDDSTDWPNSANQLPKAEDAIGMALFGPDAFPPTSTSLPSRFHSLYMAFGNRCWARTRAKVKNDLKKLEQYKVSIAADFKAIQALETPPKKQLLQVLRDVKKLKDLCQLYSIEKNRVHIEEVEDMLNDMLISVGVGVQPRKGPVKTRAAPTKAPQRLASEEDMLELQGVYDAYFGELDASTSEPPLHDLADAELQEALGKADSDALGMDEEAKMSIQQLDLDLGTQHGLTFQCNTIQHPDGYTLWTNPDSFNSNTPPLVPH